MTTIRLSLALLFAVSPWVAHADSETYQYCSGIYPTETYQGEERDLYVQECIQAYEQTTETDAAAPEPLAEAAAEEEIPPYEGTVDQFVAELPTEETSPPEDLPTDDYSEPAVEAPVDAPADTPVEESLME
jgi:hypothetical protein